MRIGATRHCSALDTIVRGGSFISLDLSELKPVCPIAVITGVTIVSYALLILKLKQNFTVIKL